MEKKLIIEVGKFYKTAAGNKVRIYATNCGEDDPVHGAVLLGSGWESRSWYSNGTYCKENTSSSDIVDEWIDKPELDWSKMAIWHKFAAMDPNGDWWVYPSMPEVDTIGEQWTQGGDMCMSMVPAEYAPKFEGSWKDSLIERPTA